MIDYIDIIIDMDSLHISKMKSITSEIYFSIGDKCFPEERWSDFPVVILTWWINVLLLIINSKVGLSDKFLFMDGPFYIKGKKSEEDIINLEFIHNIGKGKTIFSTECSVMQLKAILLKVSKKLIWNVLEKGWETEDVRNLNRAITLLDNK